MDIEAAERLKYEAVWRNARYRKFSPGEKHFEQAALLFGSTGSLIDYGCGTGRATARFRDLGLSVTGVDFAANALEADIPFIEACLWDLPDLSSDWAYCTDVMEHIPPEKVGAVLDGIAAATCRAAFFSISTRRDVFGPKLIGEPLHLTVRPHEWWETRLGKRFEHVERCNDSYVCR